MRLISLHLSRAGVLVLLALTALLALAAPAMAADGSTPQFVNIFDTAQLIALVGGVLIPFVVALLAKQHASGWFKGLLALVSAGLLALGTYLTNTDGAHTWRGAVSVIVVAIVMAGASRYAVTGGLDNKLAAMVPGGIGPAMTPEKAAAKHSHGQDLTVPVPPEIAP